MNFACPSCQRRYTVPDEKVRGKSVKVKCKACGATITIEGPRDAPAPPPPTPNLSEDFEDRTVAFRSEEILKLREQDALLAKAPKAARTSDAPIWFVMVGDAQQGPLDVAGLRSRKVAGDVTADSFVWKDGMEEWKAAKDVAELGDLFPVESPPAVEVAPEFSAVAEEPPPPAVEAPAPEAEAPAPSEPPPDTAAASEAAPEPATAPPPSLSSEELFAGDGEGTQPGAAPVVEVVDRAPFKDSPVAAGTPASAIDPVKKGGAGKTFMLILLVVLLLGAVAAVLAVLGVLPLGQSKASLTERSLMAPVAAPAVAPAAAPAAPAEPAPAPAEAAGEGN